jgi:hypothetical protein
MKTSVLAAAAVAALAAPAFAQPAPAPGASPFPISRTSVQQQIQSRFGTRDANHDGQLDNTELGAGAPQALARLDANRDSKVSLAEATNFSLAEFDRADSDHDGSVSEAEANAMMAAAPPPPQPQPQGN